jgi:hypothetical protein
MWPFKKREPKTIHVQLVDVAGVVKFAPIMFPVERLPASFEADTTMHRPEGDWQVIEARPVSAEEFKQTGKLTLLVQKLGEITNVPLGDVLFSLPTISNDLPAIAEGSSKLGKNVLELHEDDWRQVEWVSASLMEPIEKELAAIRNIYEHERVDVGFRKVHVRDQIPQPLLDATLNLHELASAVGKNATMLDGVSYAGVAGLVENAFALRLISSIEIYGLVRDSRLHVAGFQNTRVNNVPDEDVRHLDEFAVRHQLLLVDWRRVQIIEANYRDYFTNKS